MWEFSCPVEYNPRGKYTRAQLIEQIESHRELLCFFVKEAGEKRCAIGVDFEKYDRKHKMVPIHIVPDWAVKQYLIPAEGKAFEEAYRRSKVGEQIVVTYTARQWGGWFEMEWGMDEEKIVRREKL